MTTWELPTLRSVVVLCAMACGFIFLVPQAAAHMSLVLNAHAHAMHEFWLAQRSAFATYFKTYADNMPKEA